jgi:hypothetical protein
VPKVSCRSRACASPFGRSPTNGVTLNDAPPSRSVDDENWSEEGLIALCQLSYGTEAPTGLEPATSPLREEELPPTHRHHEYRDENWFGEGLEAVCTTNCATERTPAGLEPATQRRNPRLRTISRLSPPGGRPGAYSVMPYEDKWRRLLAHQCQPGHEDRGKTRTSFQSVSNRSNPCRRTVEPS